MRLMRHVGQGGCAAPEYAEAITGGDRTVIDTLPDGKRNVTLQLRLNGKPLKLQADGATRDLLDLAVAVYIGDELVPRRKSPDGWTRSFDYLVPVQDPTSWAKSTDVLRRTLTQLAGDNFSFTWPGRGELPPLGRHRQSLPEGYDAVCLFSGGVDSLLGAYQLISEGRRVLLVGHQADPTTAGVQKKLANVLREHFPTRAAFIQCRVSRSSTRVPRFALPKKVEESHRPRSFLFLSIAVAVARAAGIKEVYIPENGLIALNSSLQISRLGSLSTRTAHPIFLSNLIEFLTAAGLYDGAIKNPFLYDSKTDMIRDFEPPLRELVVRSISCARPSRYKNLHVNHCGYCVPCVYRRVAFMEGGLDRPADYAYDVFTGLGGLSKHKQADFRALVDFAGRVVSSTTMEREMMVLAHGAFPPEVGTLLGPRPADGYSPWTNMMLRWAKDFLVKVRGGVNADVREIISMRPTVRGASA